MKLSQLLLVWEPGAVVSKFAFGPISGGEANFETKTTPGINKLLVSFDSETCLEADIEIMRISESGHQGTL